MANANTVPAVFWSVFFILRDPELRARVSAELSEAFHNVAARGTDMLLSFCRRVHLIVLGEDQLNYDDLRQLHVIQAVVMESLRLFSSTLVVRYVRTGYYVCWRLHWLSRIDRRRCCC